MSEVYKIILTSSLTVIGGVIVYTLSQLLSLFVLQPVHELKRHTGIIADLLIYHAHIYCNPGVAPWEVESETSKALRQSATTLLSKAHMVPFYGRLSAWHMIPNAQKIESASRNLILLSNNLGRRETDEIGNRGVKNSEAAGEIKRVLNLRIK